ncbi:MAG TPA: hypothetical protein VHE35_13130 [Kofleriaceae bacterium]|nr:hypothetical protein [Kofleriaceae bacterium]
MPARALVIQLVVALAVVAGSPSPGSARPAPTISVDAELLTVHATRHRVLDRRGRSTTDPLLGRQPALAKPPFSAYKGYRVLRRGAAILATGMAWKTRLPNHRDLMIALARVIVPKKRTEPTRFVITASLATAGSTGFRQVLEAEVGPGDIVFVPADAYRGGLVVVGIKLAAH